MNKIPVILDTDIGTDIDDTWAAMEILKDHDIPVLFLSSNTEKEVVEKTEKITSYGYVVKNSSPTALFASIKMAFGLHAANLTVRCANVSLENEVGMIQYVQIISQDITDLKEAKEALSESEHLFRKMSENALASIYIVQDERLVYINPALARKFGYEPYELMGADPLILIHPNDRELVTKNFQLSISDDAKTIRYEFHGIHKDGTTNRIEVLESRAEINGCPAIIGSIMDVTDGKKT